jgi:uncharacterized membrane protein (DUF485 family)
MKSDIVHWQHTLESEAFVALRRQRRNTVVGLGILAALGYFSIPALIAWAPSVFTIRITSGINLGTLFAAGQYPFGGLIVYLFLRRTAAIDRAASAVLANMAAASPDHTHTESRHAS